MLDIFDLVLGDVCDLAVAGSGEEALEIVESSPPFAAVLSDFRMPGMDGIELLRAVRERDADSVLLLLTGFPNLATVIESLNSGLLFRYLEKPTDPGELQRTIAEAVERHRLLTSEQVLLEQTLFGSIHAMLDLLGAVLPEGVARADRVERNAEAMARRLDVGKLWKIKVASMVTQLGYVALPRETVLKIYRGRELGGLESEQVGWVPQTLDDLLGNIPRLEPVREILSALWPFTDGREPARGSIPHLAPVEARILKVALDYDILRERGLDPHDCLDEMRARTKWYDPPVLDVLVDVVEESLAEEGPRELGLLDLEVGMILANDVMSTENRLLVKEGNEVTTNLISRLRHQPPGSLQLPIRVLATRARPQ